MRRGRMRDLAAQLPAEQRQLRAAERRAMGARRQRRRGQAGSRGRSRRRRAPRCRRRARWSPRKSPGGERRRRAPFASWIRFRCPTAPDLAQNYWWLRGRRRVSDRPSGARARAPSSSASAISRDPAALRASRDELFEPDSHAAERGVSLKPPPKTDPIVAGWLALGPVAVEMTRNPMRAAAALDELEARRTRSIRPTTACSARRRPRSPSPPNFPIRSRCCCRCRAAPRRSASRCATASSPPIWNRTPPRGRT